MMRWRIAISLLRCLSEWDKQDTIFLEMQRAILCDDRDFNTAMTIIDCLVSHTARVYSVLATEDKDPFRYCTQQPSAKEIQYYKALPEGREFKAKEAEDIALSLGIPVRTASRYLGTLVNKCQVIKRIRQGYYTKIPHKEQ